ncbi:MAG: hypothetical protein P8X64_04620 [Anaerolineales bacterium]
MKREQISTITIYFDEQDQDSARLVMQATRETEELLRSRWSLAFPPDCLLLVMTSWFQFVFNASPMLWRIPLVLTLPLWAGRVASMWKVAGGWTNRFGRRVAIGVKPPALLEAADRRIGERIFVKQVDPQEKVRQITCHELTHAATSRLKLPLWLNEGLAARAVDHFSGQSTIRIETLESLVNPGRNPRPLSYRQLRTRDRELVVYQFARGYWLTRWLDETEPDVLLHLISTRLPASEIENLLAETLGLDRSNLWPDIDRALYSRYARTDDSLAANTQVHHIN